MPEPNLNEYCRVALELIERGPCRYVDVRDALEGDHEFAEDHHEFAENHHEFGPSPRVPITTSSDDDDWAGVTWARPEHCARPREILRANMADDVLARWEQHWNDAG